MSEDFRDGHGRVLNKRTPNWQGKRSNIQAGLRCRWLWAWGFLRQLLPGRGCDPYAVEELQEALIHPMTIASKIAALRCLALRDVEPL
jgi:hypothetical protein